MSKPKYYLTTPVYDAASEPQIGSLYTAILCDTIARHKRMCGFEIAHFMGGQTHGVSPENTEKRTGTAQASSLQRHEREFEELLNLADVHCTHFERAGSAGHILAVNTLLRRTMRHSRLAIYKARYQGRYCFHDQIDVSESVEPADCAICGRAAALISEDRHFFRLSAFQDQLTALYKYRPAFIQPQFQLDEIRRLVAGGLKDIPISRRSDGSGIPWPDDPDRIVCGRYPELSTYLSCVGFGEAGHGSDEFRRHWPPNLHVIGEKALRSHAIYWPAFLMAADLPLPRHIFAHGTLSFEQEGTDHALLSEPIVQVLGTDALRYYLLSEVGYGENAHAGYDGLVRRYNADLAKSLGSLANRILALLARHGGGGIPVPSLFSCFNPTIEIIAEHTRADVRFLFDSFHFSEGLKKIWSLIAAIDRLLADNARYELMDDPSEKHRFIDVLHDACEGLGWIALLLHPVLPRATDAIWRSLGQTTRLEDQLIDETPWSCLMPGTRIGKLEALFPGVDNPKSVASAKPEIGRSA
jgi:methionyl-tRNA synthetase